MHHLQNAFKILTKQAVNLLRDVHKYIFSRAIWGDKTMTFWSAEHFYFPMLYWILKCPCWSIDKINDG